MRWRRAWGFSWVQQERQGEWFFHEIPWELIEGSLQLTELTGLCLTGMCVFNVKNVDSNAGQCRLKPLYRHQRWKVVPQVLCCTCTVCFTLHFVQLYTLNLHGIMVPFTWFTCWTYDKDYMTHCYGLNNPNLYKSSYIAVRSSIVVDAAHHGPAAFKCSLGVNVSINNNTERGLSA